MLNAITITGSTIVTSERKVRESVRQTHDSAGRFWHRQFARLHFMPSAIGRYGYRSRTSATQRRKKQLAAKGLVKKGGIAPLVWSGTTEDQVLRTPTFRATPARVVVTMFAPSYVNHRFGRLAREITDVAPTEVDQLNKHSQEVHDRAILKITEPYRFRTR